MPTISLSTPYAFLVTDNLTTSNISSTTGVTGSSPNNTSGTDAIANAYTAATQVNFLMGSIFSELRATTSTGGVNGNPYFATASTSVAGNITFRNSSNSALATYAITELTRVMDVNGYVTISNFPPKIPSVAGTISTVIIETGNKSIVLTVGAPGGQSDVQFDDRVLVTNQPWRLDGSVKFRVPVSYEYTV
jgi:hypothetical protein